MLDTGGDSNIFDFDQVVPRAERLDMDLSTQVVVMYGILILKLMIQLGILIPQATVTILLQAKLRWRIIQYMKVVHDGSSGDFDLIQSSVLVQQVLSCYSHMDLNIDSENATVTITQKD